MTRIHPSNDIAGKGAVAAPLIVQVVRQYAPGRGGLEDVVANLSRLLRDRGFRVRVVTLDSLFTARDRRLPDAETIDGVEVVRIPWKGSSRYPIAPSVFRHIADADLVHVHGIDFFFDALAWTRLLHGKPMVATTHGGFFHTPKYAAIKKLWFRTVTRLSSLAYRSLLCCSQSDMALFSRIASDRAVLVENGVDTVKFAGLSSATATRRIVTIGRFSVNKRLDRLFDAMAVLTRRSEDWHLDVVGSPSDHSAADLSAEIARRGLSDHVTLHVGVDNEAVKRLIGGASLFASASEYEGFGLVAVEAMSAGLVPVLHANEAYQVLARQHPGVFLADFAQPEQSARQIEKAFDLLSGDAAAKRSEMMAASAVHAWDAVADRYIDIYKQALGPAAIGHLRSLAA
ncbi:glycosyltransferase family 4 protein [Rhizobium sp. S-51]|jgi:alpha-1,3-mannosyltransferase|uniref:Glycosyltransferase family 4 protein n=1 Tax=Rhizobium terricola TaxID=2728849 RepID=A0A7Y0FXR9_9HYPH|nr:glycosyltransferase family 4 protein [Rhizobium terricola]NML75974.1 glycosyltransferase family 4 protein [Rhizobium terricola]